MYKRLAAGLLAVASAVAIVGAPSPAVAATTPQPCAPYPPGQVFSISAIPGRVTINRGTNVKLVAVVWRGASHTPCDGFLTILRYGYSPTINQQAKRTDYRGVAVFIGYRLMFNRTYFFRVYCDVLRRSWNVGQIFVV